MILRPALLVPLALLLATAPAKADGSLELLTGRWASEPTARGAESTTHLEGRWTLDGAWLQVEVADLHASGRTDRRLLMLRQEDESVAGYGYAADEKEAGRVKGAWAGDRELALEGPFGTAEWRWIRESKCTAVLLRRVGGDGAVRREGKRLMKALDCEPMELTDKPPTPEEPEVQLGPEGRPMGAKPERQPAQEKPSREPLDREGPDADEPDRRPERPERPTGERPVETEPSGKPQDDSVDRDGGEVESIGRSRPEPGAEAGAEENVAVAELPAARAPEPTSPATGAKAATAGRTVLVAGRGKPLDEVQKAINMVREWLTEQGVAVEAPTDEIVVLQEADASLAYLVREVRDRGAASLIYVSASFGGRERIVVECYDGNGLLLWSEKTVGGTGIREFKWLNEKLVERIQEKLAPRIGGAGLPTSDTPPS